MIGWPRLLRVPNNLENFAATFVVESLGVMRNWKHTETWIMEKTVRLRQALDKQLISTDGHDKNIGCKDLRFNSR